MRISLIGGYEQDSGARGLVVRRARRDSPTHRFPLGIVPVAVLSFAVVTGLARTLPLQDAAAAEATPTTRVIGLATPPAGVTRFMGSPNKDQLGDDLAIGNLNGDTKADLVLGAHWSSDSGRNIVGRTYVTFGRSPWPASFDLGAIAQRDWSFIGTGHEARMGTSVAVGDLDGDGLDDLIMGSLLADPKVGGDLLSNAGSVYIMYGRANAGGPIDFRWDKPDSLLNGRSDNLSSDQLGTTLAVGDWNGDGKHDLAVGAMFRPNAMQEDRVGAVFVWWGPLAKGTTKNLVSDDADWTLLGATAEGYFGAALASGDLTGDGIDDLVVSALSDGEATTRAEGVIYVFAGRQGLGGKLDMAKGDRPTSLLVGTASMYAGIAFTLGSCSCRGQSLLVDDLGGDRRPDLVVGSPRDAGTRGSAVLIDGPVPAGVHGALELASRRYYGAAIGDQLGWSVASGDLDGDGQRDLVTTAPKADAPKAYGGFADAGAAIGLRGPLAAGLPLTLTEASAALWVWGPDTSAGNAGMSAGIADTDGDGASDLHLGFPDAAPLTRHSSGAAYRLPGPLLTRLATPTSSATPTPSATPTLPPTATSLPSATAPPSPTPSLTATPTSASNEPSATPPPGPTATRAAPAGSATPTKAAGTQGSPSATRTPRPPGAHKAYLPRVLKKK